MRGAEKARAFFSEEWKRKSLRAEKRKKIFPWLSLEEKVLAHNFARCPSCSPPPPGAPASAFFLSSGFVPQAQFLQI